MRLELSIRLLSPLHIACAIKGKGAIERKSYSLNDGQRAYLPYIKSNNLRNRVRRACQDIINDTLIQQGRQISLEVYRGLANGAASGQPDKNPPSLDVVRSAQKHIYLGLFGGGRFVLPSSLKSADADPVTTPLIESGLVSDHWLDSVADHPLAYSVMRIRGDRSIEFRDHRAPSVVKEYSAAMTQWLTEVQKNRTDRKKQKGDGGNGDEKAVKKSDLNNMFEMELVSPGVTFVSEWSLPDDATPAQVGFLLSGLHRFAETNELGGLVAHGLGRFSLGVSRIEDDGERTPLIQREGNAYGLSDEAGETMEAMEDELESLDLDELESYYVQ